MDYIEIRNAIFFKMFANYMILNKPNRRTDSSLVNLHYSDYRINGHENLGDSLSPVIVDWILQRKKMTASKSLGGVNGYTCMQ